MCLVDDAQWLDRSSAQVLSFVARRLEAESVLMVFAERDSEGEGALAGLPELRLQRLSDADARALYESTNLGVFDERLAPPSPACKVDVDEHHADRDEAENDPSPLRHAA